MPNQSRTKRAAGEFRLHRQFNDTRRCQLVGERQILELISLGAPLAGILNKLCMMIDIRIGNVVSIVSLAGADANHFCSVTQSALQVGLEVFSCSAILACDRTFLGALEIYGCDPRRPTQLEVHLIQKVVQLAALALQSHELGNEFERSVLEPKERIVRPLEKPPFIN
jgi:ABC-type uncharacterized transport system permease subunit